MRVFAACGLSLAVLALAAATGAMAEDVAVPPALQGWEAWVLDGNEYVRCPYASGLDATQASSHVCAWPGPLELDATADGARFEQQVRTYATDWLDLPGDAESWPQDVRVDGAAAVVVERAGRPAVRLSPGVHSIAGRLRWGRMPESVAIPPSVGILRLTIQGARVELPEREVASVRLGAAQRAIQANQFDVRVYRKLTDGVPGVLVTRLLLHVAGEAREESVGPLLPAGFTPLEIDTPLPARLEPDGRLRIQVRPGVWSLEVAARAPSTLDVVKRPVMPQAGSASADEVWSFEAVDRLRVASVEGAEAIDPAQANVPTDWQSLPAYRVGAGGELRVVERSRGFGGQDLNRIHVTRNLWRDFDGRGYTFHDAVSGTVRQHWRLDMAEPYGLQGATSAGQPLLVTRGDAGRAGVEFRLPAVQLEGTGRIEGTGGGLPATGWDTRLASLEIVLHLPPGSRLLATLGVDESPTAWLDRWRLLDIFVVLLVVAAAFRVAGWPVAVLALVALVLSHHESAAPTWLFLNLLIAIALAQAAPETGRLRRWAASWRNVSFALVLIALVPFALYQARLAFFPQLETAPSRIDSLTVRREVAQQPPPAAATFGTAVPRAQEAREAKAINVAAAPPAPPPAALPRYAPGTLLQSGPGVPSWSYQAHPLRWNGPVEPSQKMRLVVLGTFAVSTWRLLAVTLLAALFVALVQQVFGKPRWSFPTRQAGAASPPAAMALLVLAGVVACWPGVAGADSPSPELLGELKQRLTRPPACVPTCVAVPQADVLLDRDELQVRLEAHAATRTVLPLPDAPQRWSVERVLVDGTAAAAVARDATGHVIIALEPGVHEVVVAGSVADAEALRVVFPQRPARIAVDAPGWNVSGVEQSRLLADSLTLTRAATRREAAGESGRLHEEYPPFVRLQRRLTLDLDWSVTNTVERLAPEQGAFTLEIPLLPGESVLSAGFPVRDGRVAVSVPAGVRAVSWNSSLLRAETLHLEAPRDAAWVEVWQVEPSPIWRSTFKGTPEVFAATPPASNWIHDFEPRPGEALDLTVTRPASIEGATVAFERLDQQVEVGQRSTDTTLSIRYRSTQGGRHVLKLPAGARLQSVTMDGQPLAVRDEAGELALPLQPGSHALTIAWQLDRGAGIVTRPAAVRLGAPGSNVGTTIRLPESRWMLFAAGGGVGPAILYWAELAVFVVVAVLLGRIRGMPLATHEWLLVGLGLSTFSWSVLLLFAAWVFALDWRRRWPADRAPWVFNAVQLGLAILTVVALGSLVSAIPHGLLGIPDMRIDGIGSGSRQLYWFHDRIAGALPQPVVVSVSVWFYKAAMLAWALWLSFALVRWVRWAWDAFSAQQRLWIGPAAVPPRDERSRE